MVKNIHIVNILSIYALFLLLIIVNSSTITNADTIFGHNLLQYFYHNYTQFNHGAYGGTPKPVIEAQYEYMQVMESDIDPWMNSNSGYRSCILSARQIISAMTQIKNYNDTVLVDNATEGINVILRNMEPPLGPDQYIFDLSTAYGPFAGLYEWIEARYGTKTITADIVFPVLDKDSFLRPVRSMLLNNTLNIRVAVISHISAYPSVILPVNELTELFHEYSIPVVVDGAHALGNIKIDISAMSDVDYYFANTHKWLFSPKSAAMLYIRHDHQLLHVPAPMLIDSPETQGELLFYIVYPIYSRI